MAQPRSTNEYRQSLNPWQLVPTHRVMHVSDLSGLRADYETFGCVVVRGVYAAGETQALLSTIREFTKTDDRDVLRIKTGEINPFVGGRPALTEPRFWPSIVNQNLARVVRLIYGERDVVEFGTSVGAHHSGWGLHRDFPQWYSLDPATPNNLDDSPNSYLRILTYPAESGVCAGSFGIVPFSHRKRLYEQKAREAGVSLDFEIYAEQKRLNVESQSSGQADALLETINDQIVWVYPDAGDVVLLDARAYHTGGDIRGPRYLLVSSFGPEDDKVVRALKNRWAKGLAPQELAYYTYLNSIGFCSDRLLSECASIARVIA